MKSKLSSLKIFLKKISRKKRTWVILGVVLLILIILISKPNGQVKNIVSETAKLTDLKQTVLATGQVVSNTDLNLSFNSSGIVKTIKVKVGDKVTSGQVLATLEQGSVLADLTSARGNLAAANAKLKRVLEKGEVSLAEIALESAKTSYENTIQTQRTLVKNAYEKMLNSTPEAVPEDEDGNHTAPIITGSYSLGKEGTIRLSLYNSSGGKSFVASGLTSGSALANSITASPIGNSGLYITFPSDSIENSEYIIEIPNKKAANYLTNYYAYESALKNEQSSLDQAKSLVDQRQKEYDLKVSTANGSDIDFAQAEVLSAQGQVEQALSRYNDTQIKAPTPGTITQIDIKLGELAQAQKEAIILQDVSNMYVESNINEANIIGLAVNMPVDITFDAFGPEQIFEGRIISIDPSSTLISGVVNYKIKVSVDQIKDLRPGMTANMTIKIKNKDQVIAIPSRSILTNDDGTLSVRLITNSKNKKYKEIPITTGMNGDGGLVEVLSGLYAGDEFVVLIKK